MDRKYNRALLLQLRSHRLTEENPWKGFGPRGESPSGRKDRKPCSKSSNESVRTRRVVIGTFPYVKITSLRLDAYVAMIAVSDTLRRRKAQQEVTERWCERISCLMKESMQLGCESQDSHPRKSVLREETWDQITPSKFLQGHVAPHKKSGNEEDPSQGIMQKVRTSRTQSVRSQI